MSGLRSVHSLGGLLVGAALALLAQAGPKTTKVVEREPLLPARHHCLTPEQEELLSHLSLVDLPDGRGGSNRTLRITGVNVQIVNGLGASNGHVANPNAVDAASIQVNGLGNLIIGYDEAPQFTANKTGSHNLVVGPYNNYTSFGGLVAGRFNRLEAPVAAVVAGNSNYARGISAAVVGGVGNGATGDLSLVAGGLSGEASANQTTVMGGQSCRASGFNSSTLGGFRNESSGALATVTGGSFNLAAGLGSVVGGGANRTAPDANDWAAGGLLEDD